MNKKLLAVAVAGALALPGVALAQSSVTISGLFSISFGNLNIGSYNAAGTRAAGSSSSENRITDNSSRIVFNVVEDLGGGLKAIGQVDWRVALDNGADTAAGGAGGPGGNTHVGLVSSQWGRVIIGRQDVHYYNTESDINTGGRGDLKVNPFTMSGFVGGGRSAIANLSRTPNIVHYTSPNWGGFTVIVAYSTSPTPANASEADIGQAPAAAVVRKGSAWNLNPNLRGSNYQIGYSYWRAKPDNAIALGLPDQRSDKIYGSYIWGGLKVGLQWDKSRINDPLNGTEISSRVVWSLPVSYTWGPHIIEGHYTKARDDSDHGVTTASTAALNGQSCPAGVSCASKMWALQYTYNLSKRTSMSATYSKITNDAGAAYNFFGATSGAIGTADAGVAPGESPRLISVSMRHAF